MGVSFKKHTLTGGVKMGGGGGGECECRLSEDLTVSNPLGRYEMDDVIKKGETFEHIFQGILGKTYYPTLSDPSVLIDYNVSSLMKVGGLVGSKTASLLFNRGSISPQYDADSPYRSGEAVEYKISLSGANVSFSETNDSGVFVLPEFTRETKGNVSVDGVVAYEAGCQPKDSDGNNYSSALPSGVKLTSKTIEFILPFYFGVSSTPTIDSFVGFSEDVSKKGRKVHFYTTANQYAIIAYDKSYGNLTSILDQNEFEGVDGWHKSETVVDGQTYNVYASEYKTTDTDAKYTFIF